MKNYFSIIAVFVFSLLSTLLFGQSLQLVDFDMNPEYMVDLNGTIFFKSGTTPTNMKLWKTDGTVEGTVKVNDIALGFSGDRLTCSNNTVFFSANDGDNGYELWKYDETLETPVLVKDINVGENPSYPSSLTDIDGILYFAADDGVNGVELWKSDGTVDGTVMIKDINPGLNDSSPRSFGSINGTLFFSANDGIHGHELWMSDGTEEGTFMVKDINSGAGSSFITTHLVELNGSIFFYLNDGTLGYRLWKTDGTDSGTTMVKDLGIYHGDFKMQLVKINGVLFFCARENESNNTGWELWKSDGTEEGTVQVKDIMPGSRSGYPKNLIDLNGTLLFNAYEDVYDKELWRSDGTEEGTFRLKDTWDGNWHGGDPEGLIVENDILYFIANGQAGRDLWRSDGTTDGTYKESNFFSNVYYYYTIDEKVKSGNDLYVLVKNNSTPRATSLWKFALPLGTSAQTFEKAENDVIIYPIPTSGKLYVSVDNRLVGGDIGLYTLDGELINLEKINSPLTLLKFDGKPGVYLVKIINGNEAITKKIVKN